jgi:hypothetical protein
MKQSQGMTRLIFTFAVLVALPVATFAQGMCGEAVQWQSILDELRGLRIQLLLEKIERTNVRMAAIQQQLQIAESDRNAVDDLERSQAEEITESQSQLFQPGLSQEERSEIEKYRLQMMTTGASRLAERRKAVVGREAELRQQLGLQHQERLRLFESLRALMSPAPRNP